MWAQALSRSQQPSPLYLHFFVAVAVGADRFSAGKILGVAIALSGAMLLAAGKMMDTTIAPFGFLSACWDLCFWHLAIFSVRTFGPKTQRRLLWHPGCSFLPAC